MCSPFWAPLAIFAPLEAPDLGRNADLGEIGLHQLGDAPGIGIVGPLHRHGPQVGRESRSDIRRRTGAFFAAAGSKGSSVMSSLYDHIDGGMGFLRRNARRQIDGVDDRFLVDGHVQRLADTDIIERLLGRVVGEIADVEPRLVQHLNARGPAHGVRYRPDLDRA